VRVSGGGYYAGLRLSGKVDLESCSLLIVP
jgi:hypothetical protein